MPSFRVCGCAGGHCCGLMPGVVPFNYAHALMEHGGEVQINETPGTLHGVDRVKGSAITRAAVETRIGFLKGIFA